MVTGSSSMAVLRSPSPQLEIIRERKEAQNKSPGPEKYNVDRYHCYLQKLKIVQVPLSTKPMPRLDVPKKQF